MKRREGILDGMLKEVRRGVKLGKPRDYIGLDNAIANAKRKKMIIIMASRRRKKKSLDSKDG